MKADEAKALSMFTEGDGGFKDRELYPYCVGPDGKFSAHPTLIRLPYRTIVDTDPFSQQTRYTGQAFRLDRGKIWPPHDPSLRTRKLDRLLDPEVGTAKAMLQPLEVEPTNSCGLRRALAGLGRAEIHQIPLDEVLGRRPTHKHEELAPLGDWINLRLHGQETARVLSRPTGT